MDIFVKKPWIFLVLLLFLQVPLLSPLLQEGYYHSHDDFSVQRVLEYKASLQNGDVPARWSDNLLYGHGYPLFIFYSPLVYAAGAIVSITGLSALTSVKLLSGLFIIGGALGIFLWLRALTNNTIGAFVGALLYSYAPYRATDLYIRGALAEFAGLSLLPWILFLHWKMVKERSKIACIGTGLLTGALVSTHHITSLLYGMFYLPYLFYAYIRIRPPVKPFLLSVFISVLIALGASGWYWIPLLIESRYIHTSTLYAFPLNFFLLTIGGLWHSPWGYGGVLEQDPLSLQLGKAMFIVVGGTIAGIPLWIAKKKFSLLYWGTIFCMFAFLELRPSAFIWDSIPLLHVLRIPWRIHLLLITIGAYISALVSVELLSLARKANRYDALLIGYFLCLSLMMATQISFFNPKMFYRESFPHETTTWDDEYLPVWVKQKPAGPPSGVRVLSGNATVTNQELSYLNKQVEVSAREEATLGIPTLWYPGWSVRLNTQYVTPGVHPEFGTITVTVPPGEHTLLLQFTKPWWRQFADILSVCTLAVAFIVISVSAPVQHKKFPFQRRQKHGKPTPFS